MAKLNRKTPLASVSATARQFPPARAFVVQLSAEESGHRPISGRVEHVLSGRSIRFESLERLSEFLGEIIAEEQPGPRGTGE